MPSLPHWQAAIAPIIQQRQTTPRDRALLVAVSGIDGSGKGYITAQLAAQLTQHALNVATINIDGWLNLPAIRFNPDAPAEQFYAQAIRFTDLFDQLVLPLQRQRSHQLQANLVDETATDYHTHDYQFANIDIILLEGIFLLKQRFQALYDVSIWLDCTWETALERAVERGQEGLPPEATIHAYQTIYFPAQTIHFATDRPQHAATYIIPNDPRLEAIAAY